MKKVDDNPHLTIEQKQQLLNLQFTLAMQGSETLLVHLGQSELNQIKQEKRLLDQGLPLAQLTLEAMYELLERRRGVVLDVEFAEQEANTKSLDNSEDYKGSVELLGVDQNQSITPQVDKGYPLGALRFNQIPQLDSNVINVPQSSAESNSNCWDPQLLQSVRTVHENRLAYDVCGVEPLKPSVAAQDGSGSEKLLDPSAVLAAVGKTPGKRQKKN
jgi:hypothetical protein